MQVCLLVNDDLQATFRRYQILQKGSKPPKFVPGECGKNTLLTPTHVYLIPDEKPKPSATGDLFDFGGGSNAQ